MSGFRSLRDFCHGLFRIPGLAPEDIVDVTARDAGDDLPGARQGVRVSFTLTYTGVTKLDGVTHTAMEELIRGDDESDSFQGF